MGRSGKSPRAGAWRRGDSAGVLLGRCVLLACSLVGLALLAGCAEQGRKYEETGDTRQVQLPLAALETERMSEPRAEHTATRLPDGRVLVAGGRPNSYETSQTAEFYDPKANLWTPAASMGVKRAGHTATLLADGRVLVLGGQNDSTELTAAEIYSPAGNIWSAVTPMGSPRWGHTATRLADGKILVAGGAGPVATGELYDPAADAWSPASAMRFPRSGHGAALLADGRVLVAGGAGDQAEIYDPATDTWSPTGTMLESRAASTVTLLADGKVLATGGAGADGSEVIDAGVVDAEIYDPATNTWTAAPGMVGPDDPYSRGINDQRAVTLPDGKVLITGGAETLHMRPPAVAAYCMDYQDFHVRTEIYDPATGGWALGPTMVTTGRGAHTATLLLDGRVLLAGGYNYADIDLRTWYAVEYTELIAQDVRPPGAACGSAAECRSGFCVSGVCCNRACDGACEACSVAGGAAVNGVCAPLTGPACDDGDACTSADACQAGACAGAPVGDGAPCDDGNACTRIDACQAGACVGADPVACAGRDACHVGLCDPASGQCVSALAPEGTACDDGNLCTRNDACQGGTCSGRPVQCRPSAACHTATCDEATGLCVESPAPDGAQCGRESSCTRHTCQSGVCTAGAPRICRTSSSCHSPGACSDGPRCAAETLDPEGAPCPDPTTSTWTVADSMDSPRYAHTATLLQDGTVLVVGGRQHVAGGTPHETVHLDSGALYDPAGDAWSASSPMLRARSRHAATLLQDGTVLVVGGASAEGRAAERYDPVADAWTEAGTMTAARADPTAALLPDGRVLVAGGSDPVSNNVLVSAELYDPATNTWTAASPMLHGRIGWSALLPNGKVLVLGGRQYNTGELYDPASDTWTPIGGCTSPAELRDFVKATLLPNGKVLVAGSDTTSPPDTHLYDPSSDTWTPGAPMKFNADGHAVVLLADGRAAVMGGRLASALREFTQVYDPASDT